MGTTWHPVAARSRLLHCFVVALSISQMNVVILLRLSLHQFHYKILAAYTRSVHYLLAAVIRECTCWEWSPVQDPFRVGSRVVRIDPLCFLARCHKRRLNQALSVLSCPVLISFIIECCTEGKLLTRGPKISVTGWQDFVTGWHLSPGCSVKRCSAWGVKVDPMGTRTRASNILLRRSHWGHDSSAAKTRSSHLA